MYIFSYLLDYRIIYEKIIESLVCWSHLDSYRRVFVCLFVFFSAGLLKLNFNDTLEQHTYFSSEQFQLGRRRNHARPGQRKFPCPRQESNSQPSGSVVGTSDKHVVFGGSWVQFSPGVRKFSLSRASMISPPSKLKMFTGSVCVLRTSVSLELIKIKLIYAITSSREKNKMARES